MSKHTPGPWTIEIIDRAEMKQAEAITAPAVGEGRAYRRVFGTRHFPVVDAGAISGRSLAECEANARLIAAAPDLLAACSGMADRLAEYAAELRAAGMNGEANNIKMIVATLLSVATRATEKPA